MHFPYPDRVTSIETDDTQTPINSTTPGDDVDLTAGDVAWDLETLLEGKSIDDLFGEAETIVTNIENYRGKIAGLDASGMAALMQKMADLQDALGRAGNYAMLKFSENTADPERGAQMMRMQELSTALATRLVFVELEWAGVDDNHATTLLADPALEFCAHYLASARRYAPHLLSEPEEKLLTEKSVSGAGAWVRLFDELTSEISVDLPGSVIGSTDDTETVSLEQALSILQHPDRAVRAAAAEGVTAGLQPGLRTRAFVFNTLLLDKATDDRLRSYPSWISSRNLSNEASDESVEALIEAVVSRYDLPQRWYSLKAQILGVDKLAFYDRMASVAEDETTIGWSEARQIVLEAYGSFSPELARVAQRFFDENWIDAPIRPNKRPGAFCAYTVPSHHPYVLLNWTGRSRDVATLAHELGHGLHAYLAREQGIFHQTTPLTFAETASVFGETVTSNAMLAELEDPNARFVLLAATLEDSIATVFRQVAMNRFEHAVHTERRDVGELSVDRFGELWIRTQQDMLGDSVDVSGGYDSWWSYIPHFMGTPGYVYAYAYGQLLALSVYARFQEDGAAFVPSYLELLSAGGSKSPTELGKLVDCDLEDPAFWSAGLDIVEGQLNAAVEAAEVAGRTKASR